MKRGLLLTVAALMSISSVAYAQEPGGQVKFSGDLNYKYEREKEDGADRSISGESTFRLKSEAELGMHWGLYARYGYRNYSIDNDSPKLSKVDQYGVKYRYEDKIAANFGVQEVAIGPFNTLIDLTDNIGEGMLKGVVVDGTEENVSYRLFGGKLDGHLFGLGKDQNTYGVEVKIPFAGLTGSLEYININNASLAAKDYYGLGLTREQGKAVYSAEYVFSSAKTDKYGAVLGVNYKYSDKDTVSLTYRNIKGNSTPGIDGIAGYNDEKGPIIGWEHTFDKIGAITVEYDKNKAPSTGVKTGTLTLEYNYQF